MRAFIVSLILLYGFFPATYAKEISAADVTSKAAIAMPDRFSAEVAEKILRSGGNAVDAAVAAQFVLAVTLPEAGNLGGGGFILLYHNGKQEFLDYREVAPAAAHRDMYLDEKGDVIANLSLFGSLSAGVPGTVQGMWQIHQRHGSLPWKDLLQPAVDYAQSGFIVPAALADSAASYSKYLHKKGVAVNFDEYFGTLKAGENFRQPELAQTLKRIRDQGEDGFYKGKTARLIADFMRNNKGLITEKDLGAYRAKWRQPISADWRDMQVISAAPPSSGGIAIVQWLKMYDFARPANRLAHNSPEYVHLLAEVGKRVFADRAAYLGDPDFYPVPVKSLLANDYLRRRAGEVNLKQISATEKIRPGLPESEDTTHFSILDQWGNAVSNTTTINLHFGSGVVVKGAGFLLNDEMDDFSAKPGTANVFGAIGGVANEIQPGKRMLSSMSPSIVLHNDKVRIVTGSPGGTTIISSVYQSILNVVDFNMNAQDVVDTPRFHHQLWPENQIRYQPGLAPEVGSALSDMGYDLVEADFGDLQVIVQRDSGLEAASQSRGRGVSRVFPAPLKVQAK